MLNEMLNEPLGQLAHRATVQRLMEVLTPVMITWLLVLFVAGYAAHLLLLATNQHPLGKVLCGKKTLPFAPVTLLQTAKMTASKDLPWATLDLVKRAGAVNFRLPIPVPNGFYMIGDYKLARDILLAHTSDKPSGVHRQLHLWKSKGDMFVSPSTFHWRMVRKSVSFAFSKREVNRMEEVCKNRLRHMTENKVDLLSLDGGTFYPCTELKRLTYETLCEAAFEYVPEESEFEEITRTLDQITTAMRHETQRPLMFMMRFFIPGLRKQIGGPAIRLYAEKILEKYLANPNKSKANTMIKLIVENEQYKSDDERVDEIMMFLIAGHDSTGITLSTILVLLAKNPLVAQKLRQEFASVPVDQRCKVPLFEYVIKESMRVMPPTSILRQIGQDLVLKSGHKIPKGAICTIPNIVYMYNDAVFKDPDQFKPERWANPTKEMMDSFMPFGLGQRNCVGQMLAKAEINTVIPSLLANYDFTVEDEGETSLNIFFEFTNIKLKVTKL